LLELLLSQGIYSLFILKKEKKDVVYHNGQKYFSNALSLRKHQSPAMFLFELTVFLMLSDRSAGTNSSPHGQKALLHFEGQVSLLF
jgi:hypothetical protein